MTKTSSEIEKAIQYCFETDFDNCGSECPYWSLPVSRCRKILQKDLQEYFKQLKDENAELKAKVEELKKSNSIFMAENAALCAELGIGVTKEIPVALPIFSDALPSDEELRGEEFYADIGDEGDP